uniref:Uncharacterized protein n=1 Tax=Cebus imitator TaxID=2715852 RepID=A0A2K5S6F0_CEBIM
MAPQMYEFHLPLSPEELLRSGGVNQYVVQEVLSIKHLPPQLRAFQAAFRAQGPLAMLEHFDTIYTFSGQTSPPLPAASGTQVV